MTTAAERAREIAGECRWPDKIQGCRCPACCLYEDVLQALLAHETAVQEECAQLAECWDTGEVSAAIAAVIRGRKKE